MKEQKEIIRDSISDLLLENDIDLQDALPYWKDLLKQVEEQSQQPKFEEVKKEYKNKSLFDKLIEKLKEKNKSEGIKR